MCKKAYALTLLDMAQRRPAPAPLCSAFARSRAEERIRAILQYRRVPAWAGICAAVLFALSASVLRHRRLLRSGRHSQPCRMLKPFRPRRLRREPDVRYIEAEIVPLAAAEAPKYVWPLENADAAVTDPYGMRVHPLTKTEQFHSGIDLAAEGGENVLAVADGTVLDCSYNEAYGLRPDAGPRGRRPDAVRPSACISGQPRRHGRTGTGGRVVGATRLGHGGRICISA